MFSIVINYFNPKGSQLIDAMTQHVIVNLISKSYLVNELILIDGGIVQNYEMRNICDKYEIKYEQAVKNENMAESYNRGVRLSSHDHVVLMANDIFVSDGWDEKLKKFIYEQPNNIIIPYLSNSDLITQIFDYNIIKPKISHPIGMTFNLNYIPKSVFRKIGPLDETLSGYFTDTDYYLRSKSANVKTLLVDLGPIAHIGKVTTSTSTNTKFESDRTIFLKKYNSTEVMEPIRKNADIRARINLLFRHLLGRTYRTFWGRFETWWLK